MKILEIVTGLTTGDGKAEAVAGLSGALARRGHSVTIAIRAAADEPLSETADVAIEAGVRVARFAPSFPGFLFFSRAMLHGLSPLVREADFVHVNGSWTFPVWWGCRCAAKAGKPFALTPHGSFDPVRLRYSAWKKRLVAPIDRWRLRHAAFIQATSEWERDCILCYSGRDSTVIPLGVALRSQSSAPERARTVLYLGRRHPLKGLDLLETAWAAFPHDGWQLKCLGPGLPGGSVAGEAKWRELEAASCLVLPTRSENFGLVVAEALTCGTPVICTKGAPWSDIVEARCGWWCDVSAEAIAESLRAMMSLTDTERAAMGERGRALIRRKYTWDREAEAFERTILGVK